MAKARAEVTIGLRTGAFRRGLARMKRGLARFAASVKRIGRGISNFGRMAGRSFLAVGAGVVFATREASRFRQQMALVNTMLGPRANIDKFTEGVRALSAELGIAKSELAQGLYQTLSASVPPQNAVAFLAEAAKSAVGGATDITTAVDGLTTVINAFGLDASQVGKVADEMFTAVKRGKTTFEELSNNIGQVANIAATAGVKTEELFAAFATLTRQGIKTDKATTGLRQALIGILKPSEDLQKQFDRMGTTGSELIRQEGLSGAFGKIAEMAKGSTEELVKLIPNVRALPAFLGLTGEKADAAAQDLSAMNDAAGKAGEAFRKMEVARQWPRLWQSILQLVERFGDVINRVAQPAVEGLSQLLQQIAVSPKFAAFLERVGKVARGLIGGIGAILQGGEARDMALEGMKDFIAGAFRIAANNVMTTLLKGAPIVGMILGEAAAKAMAAAANKAFTEREFEEAEKQLVQEGRIDKKFGRRQVFGVTLGASPKDQAAIEARMEANRNRKRMDEAKAQGDRLAQLFGADSAQIGKMQMTLGKWKIEDASEMFEKKMKELQQNVQSFVDSPSNLNLKQPIEELLAPAAGGGAPGAAAAGQFSSLRRIGANIIGGAGGGQDVQKKQLSVLEQIKKQQKEMTRALKDRSRVRGVF